MIKDTPSHQAVPSCLKKTEEGDGLDAPQRYWAAFAIAIGVSLSVIDGTIVHIALPVIAKDLNVTAAESVRIVNAYQLVAVMVLLPLAGLGDKIGYRRIFLFGFMVFIVSSLWCAVADSLFSLTAARAVQGFGAACLMCVGSALVRCVYPAALLGRGLGINAMVVAGSTAAGPTIASAILWASDWSWLFLINIPLGLIGVFVGLKVLPLNTPHEGRFDGKSAVLSALTFGTMLFFVESVGHGQTGGILFWELSLALVIGTVFIRRQLRTLRPMLPVDLLGQPLFALSVTVAVTSFAAQMLTLVSLPFFLNDGVGLDLVTIGILYTAWPLSVMCMAVWAGRLADHYSAGILGFIGLCVAAVGLFLLSELNAESGAFAVILSMMICGFGFGLFQTPNTRLIVGSAPRDRMGSVSGMIGTVRLTGQTIGASLAALMLNIYAPHSGKTAIILAAILSVLAAFISLTRLKFQNKESEI